MKKYILSNWMNVAGIVLGLFTAIFALAISQLIGDTNPLSFESVVVETVGGSLVSTYVVVIYHFPVFLITAALLFCLDYILISILSLNRFNAMLVQSTIMLVLFVVFRINYVDSNMLLAVPIGFLIAQYFRHRKYTRQEA